MPPPAFSQQNGVYSKRFSHCRWILVPLGRSNQIIDQPWRMSHLHHFPEQPVASFQEQIFHNIQPEPSLAKIKSIIFCLEKRLPPTLLTPFRDLQRVTRPLLSLLFSNHNNPHSLSCSPKDSCSRPFINFSALFWMCSRAKIHYKKKTGSSFSKTTVLHTYLTQVPSPTRGEGELHASVQVKG